MKITKFLAIPVMLAVFAISVGTASAQVIAPRVALQFATNGLTSPLVASGADEVIARLLLDTTGSTEAVRISSLPFNLITGNGAMASTLRNCRVFNESDLSTTLNNSSSSISLSNGINSIALNNPLILPVNTLTTLSLRCDVAGDLVSGGTYTINMNTGNVIATGASTGLPAVVSVRGGVVVPPVVIPPTIPGLPTTGASGEVTQTFAMLGASLLMASLGFSYLTSNKRQS